MNQLIWHFGFATQINTSIIGVDGWLFQNDQTHLADEYAKSAISHLNKMLIFKPHAKGSKQKNPRTKKDIEAIENWLKSVMCINSLYKAGCEKGASKHFSSEAEKKLWLLFRGHILELEQREWFKQYISNCKNNKSREPINGIVKKFFNYSEWNSMKDEWRRRLMSATGIQICPYCDRQYITTFSGEQTTGLCEKISVKSKTVIKTVLPKRLKSRSNFLQYTTDTVICQDTSAISLMEWSAAEWNQADSRRLSRAGRDT